MLIEKLFIYMKRTFNAKGFVELVSDDGKILYNGGIVSTKVFIPTTEDYSSWEELSLEELYLSEDGAYLKINDGASTPFIYNNLETDDDIPIDGGNEENTPETIEDVVEDTIEIPDKDGNNDLTKEGILFNFRN